MNAEDLGYWIGRIVGVVLVAGVFTGVFIGVGKLRGKPMSQKAIWTTFIIIIVCYVLLVGSAALLKSSR